MKLIALDLDGTVTQHRTPLCKSNRDFLISIQNKYKLVMVCAGETHRVMQQLQIPSIDIIGSYGLSFYSGRLNKHFINEDFLLTNLKKREISEKIFKLRDKFDYSDYLGNSVEFHDTGVVTFPLLGTKAPIENKVKFDPDRKLRRKIYNHVIKEFKGFNVFIGGSSSFDLVPAPFDKLYALSKYIKDNQIKIDDVVYFGDDFGYGGNDSPIIQSNIKHVEIGDYNTFIERFTRYVDLP